MDRVKKRTSVSVQKFKPGSGKVVNVKSKTKASQGAAWSAKPKDLECAPISLKP